MSNRDWHTDAFPELRPGPPWVMQEMIAAQPALVQALLESPPPGTSGAVEAIAAALTHNRPVIVCGCGTSEHAAARNRRAALGRRRPGAVAPRAGATRVERRAGPRARRLPGGLHDGETRASTLALLAARTAGARTIAITHQPDASVARAAERVLITPRHDDSWCHTVAYTSALAAGAAIAGRLGPLAAKPAAARQFLEHATRLENAAPIADRLADRRVVLCAGAQADHTTARELALKIAEGARLPTLALELELSCTDSSPPTSPPTRSSSWRSPTTPNADTSPAAPPTSHAPPPRSACPSPDCSPTPTTERCPPKLTPAGRLVTDLADPNLVDRELAGLLAGAGALQTLTLELAHARHTNPDLIRREQAPYRHAAQEAENSPDW